MSVVVVPLPVSRVQPLLVLALQLVVEDHALDLGAALGKPLGRLQVRVLNLHVVLEFQLAFHAGVVLLARVMTLPPTCVQELTAAVCQRDRDVALAMHPDGLNQSLFTQMAEVPAPRVCAPSVMVPQLARGDDTEGAGGRQGATLGPAQGVFAAPRIVDHFALLAARQVEIAHERVTGVASPVVAIARPFIRPIAGSGVVVRIATVRTWTTPRLSRVVIAIAMTVAEIVSLAGLVPFVIAIAAIPLARVVVAITRIVAPARIVKHISLQRACHRLRRGRRVESAKGVS